MLSLDKKKNIPKKKQLDMKYQKVIQPIQQYGLSVIAINLCHPSWLLIKPPGCPYHMMQHSWDVSVSHYFIRSTLKSNCPKMLVFSIQFTSVSTKYNTIHSTVVVLSHRICVWLCDYQHLPSQKKEMKWSTKIWQGMTQSICSMTKVINNLISCK